MSCSVAALAPCAGLTVGSHAAEHTLSPGRAAGLLHRPERRTLPHAHRAICHPIDQPERVTDCTCRHVLRAGNYKTLFSKGCIKVEDSLQKADWHQKEGRSPMLSARGTVPVHWEGEHGAGDGLGESRAAPQEELGQPVKRRVLPCSCREVWLKRRPGGAVQGVVLGAVLPQDRALAPRG